VSADNTLLFLQGHPFAEKDGQSVWNGVLYCPNNPNARMTKNSTPLQKVIKLTNAGNGYLMDSARTEATILKRLGRTNFSAKCEIIIDEVQIQGEVYHAIVMTNSGLSLDRLPRAMIKKLKLKTYAALKKLHKAGVIHGDIRLPNFVYDVVENRVRIIDFGESFILNEATSLCDRLSLFRVEIAKLDEIFSQI
jgi:serine/threonine protein kinase